jgi:hypothetical protein
VIKILVLNKISDVSNEYMKQFRNNADIICGLSMLRQNMPTGTIPPLTPPLTIQNIEDDIKNALMIK